MKKIYLVIFLFIPLISNAQKGYSSYFYEADSEVYLYSYNPLLNIGSIASYLSEEQQNRILPILEYGKNLQLYYADKTVSSLVELRSNDGIENRFERSTEWIWLDKAKKIMSLRYLPLQLLISQGFAYFHSSDTERLRKKQNPHISSFLSANSIDLLNRSDFFIEVTSHNNYLYKIISPVASANQGFFISIKYNDEFFYKVTVYVRMPDSKSAKKLKDNLTIIKNQKMIAESYATMYFEIDGNAVLMTGLWSHDDTNKLIARIIKFLSNLFFNID